MGVPSSSLLLLLTTTIGFGVSELRDNSIIDYLNSVVSFESYSKITEKGSNCPAQICNITTNEEEDPAQERLMRLLSPHIPFLNRVLIEEMKGDFRDKEVLCGPYLLKFTQDSFVHATVKNGSLFGPMVTFHNRTANVRVVGKEEDYGEWEVMFRTAVYTKSKRGSKKKLKKYLVPFLKGKEECPILVMDEELRTRLATLESLAYKSSFLIPTFKDSSDHLQFDLPNHLANEKDKELLLIAQHSLNCQKLNYKSLPLVADKDLFDNKAEVVRHTKWSKDGECSKLDGVVWHERGALHTHFLACFPGSGSKWVLEMVQFATGLGTTELLTRHSPQLVIKTHHHDPAQITAVLNQDFNNTEKDDLLLRTNSLEVRLQMILLTGGRGILLIRNPYEAILSWWNHVLSNSGYSTGLEKEDLINSLTKGDRFRKFAMSEIELWRAVNLDWIHLVHDLIVVNYEDVKLDWEKEIRRMLLFLKVSIDEDRLRCLARNPVDVFKRKKVEIPGSVFCSEVKERIEKAISEVQDALKARGLNPLPTHAYKYFGEVKD